MEIKHDKNTKQFYFDEKEGKGRLKYSEVSSNVLDYQSTFIDEEIRGEGFGKALVKYALDYAKDKNLKIIPTCRMVSVYITRNKEYEGLIA